MARRSGKSKSLSTKVKNALSIILVAAAVLIAFLIFFNIKKMQDQKRASVLEATIQMEKTTDELAESDTSAEETEGVYIIKGNDKSSNRFERADKLCYTDTLKYTKEDLEKLDAYGLRITRNEIYARHGRMFSEQDLQNYFDRQSWYVPSVMPEKFDDEVLNDIENYNINLIVQYEMEYE